MPQQTVREHVPARLFAPARGQGYRSDLAVGHSYTTRAPISLGGVRVVDILQHGARAVPNAGDQILSDVPYGIIKIYLTWPGYDGARQLVAHDLYTGGVRPTRGSLAFAIARMYARFFENCAPFMIHPAANKWRIGENGLSLHNVIFKDLVNTFENVWQVSCDVAITVTV